MKKKINWDRVTILVSLASAVGVVYTVHQFVQMGMGN